MKNSESSGRSSGNGPTANLTGNVRFGPFTLDPHLRKLWRNDALVPLPSRALDALAYLIAHRDRMVEREEVIDAVWHDVAVTDDSLVHAVSVLRRTLGDDPSLPTFIETIPRRGYRFIGRVETMETTAPREAMPGSAAAQPTPSHPRSAAWRARPIAAAAIGLVFVTAVIYVGRGFTTEGLSDAAVRLEQIAPPGTTIVSSGIVSPVGRHLAFVTRDDRTGKTLLWIRAIDATAARALPDTEGASHPFFSPDGQMVAFFRNGQLVASDIRGERRRTVAPVRGAPAGGSWGTHGVIVFAEWMTGLFAVSESGGSPSALTRLDHTALDVAHAWPQFLPDGRRFLYQVVSPDTTRAGVYVSSLDARTSTRLLDDTAMATYVAPGFLLYVQHDLLMAEPFDDARLQLGGRPVLLSRSVTAPSLAEGNVVSASQDILAFRAGAGKQQLTWVNRSGERQGALDVPASMFNFRVSSDGQYVLAASSLTDSTGVWLVDLARRHSTQLTPDGIAPLWSPDGTRVAFTARGGLDVHVRPSGERARVEPLFSDQSVKILNDWSGRSQTIIYTRHDPVTNLDLWHVPLAGGAPRPLLNTPFNEAHARLSPDGRWLAYVSDESGTQEVYVRRYPDLDAPRQVSIGGGGQPQWRADQRELFYLSPDRYLMAASVVGGRDVSFEASRRLFRTSIAEGLSSARESYAAMPDGRSFLLDERGDASIEPITLLLHWANGLTSAPGQHQSRREPTQVAAWKTR